MERLYFSKETYLPEVNLDAQNDVFEIKGKCIPENAAEFFQPILQWINDYSNNPSNHTNFKFHLEYFNTSSSKYILEVLRKLEKIYIGCQYGLIITWYYEQGDTDVEEAGIDYQTLVKVPFELICLDSNGEFVEKTVPIYPLIKPLTAHSITAKTLIGQSQEDTDKINQKINQDILDANETQKFIQDEKELSVLNSISDRLQKKLNQANEKLIQQTEQINSINTNLNIKNVELQDTINALTKAKAGRRATTIVLFIALFLFVISELIEYQLESQTQYELSIYWIISIKLAIALLLKPIETLLEKDILQKTSRFSIGKNKK